MNALEAMGFSIEEVRDAESKRHTDEADKKTAARQVCLCGHSIGRHKTLAQYSRCIPSAMKCPCVKFVLAGIASDARFFLKKTEGSVQFHALARGVKALLAAGGTFEWKITECARCKHAAADLAPVTVSQRGVGIDIPSQFNALLCGKCRREI